MKIFFISAIIIFTLLTLLLFIYFPMALSGRISQQERALSSEGEE